MIYVESIVWRRLCSPRTSRLHSGSHWPRRSTLRIAYPWRPTCCSCRCCCCSTRCDSFWPLWPSTAADDDVWRCWAPWTHRAWCPWRRTRRVATTSCHPWSLSALHRLSNCSPHSFHGSRRLLWLLSRDCSFSLCPNSLATTNSLCRPATWHSSETRRTRWWTRRREASWRAAAELMNLMMTK